MDQTPPATPPTSSDVRTWCVLCHASALLGLFFHFLVQISMLIYDAIAAILCVFLIGIPILIALWVLNTVLVIIASVKAGQGEFYRYPFTIRLIN